MQQWQAIASEISRATDSPFKVENVHAVSGGCINKAAILEGCGQRYFVKTNTAALADMFAAEGEALAEMSRSRTIKVPRPVCWGEYGGQSWLVLECLQLGGHGNHAQLGEQLAAMHQVSADRYGWHRDNTIGSTAQLNGWHDEWVAFFQQRRLAYQLSLAASKGHGGRLQRLGEKLLGCVADYFEGYTPAASMLHGDLWGGNYSFTNGGVPVIFDPAFYYGDREADIAMTELFGGFGAEFRDAYNNCLPLDSGYPVRRTLYNTYHILNHLNLFGGGYAMQAENMIEQLLSERD